MIKGRKLFAPGPVNTSARVKNVMRYPDICHRTRDFEELYQDLKNNIFKLFKVTPMDYSACVISGSGTASNEAVISSVVSDNKEILLISNGEFGYRIADIVKTYRLKLRHLEFGWGKYPDLNVIEDVLRRHKDIQLIAMVYHETSTGMINPVHEVGMLAEKYGKVYFVDAISAVGSEDVDLNRDNIDFCTGVPNKSIAGLPGVSFVCVKKESIKRLSDIKPRNVYLDLRKHLKIGDEINQTPNTPSVYIMLALNEALKELFDEGLENRIKRYKEDAEIIRTGLKEMELEFLLKDEDHMSNTVTSVFLPERIKAVEFVSKIDEEGYVIYLGKGPLLEKNMIQVANMGQIYPDDCRDFIRKMNTVLKDW